MQNPLIGLDNLKTFLDNLKLEIQKAEDKAKQFTTEKNNEQDLGVQEKITQLKNELVQNITNVATESNKYTDRKITENNTNYVDNHINATKTEVKKYTDDSIQTNNTTINQTIDAAKEEAKKHADDSIIDTKTEITKKYTEEINAAKDAAKNYTDTQTTDITNQYQQYTNTKIDAAKTEVKQYTDTKTTSVTQEVKTYTDTKVQETKTEIKKDLVNEIKTEIVKSIDDGAVKLMKDELTTEYKKYTDDSQSAQNTVIDDKLQKLKKTMENYSDHNVSELIGGAPEVLNTLYELSNALGNDPNFSTTIMNILGQKLNSSDVTTVPEPNKVLRLDSSGKIPASVLGISGGSGGGFITSEERDKLAGIEEGANKYIHPSSHPASMITEETNRRFMTDTERNKLSTIAENANNYVHPSTHPATIIVEDSTHRFTSDAEKSKLAGIENGANRYVHPASHPGTMITEDASHRWFTDAERSKLAGIQAGATAGGGITGVNLPDNNVTGVLPVGKGGTGATSKEGITNLLISSGNKINDNLDGVYIIAFNGGATNGGHIKLSELRAKFLPTDEEFKQYLLRLPTI